MRFMVIVKASKDSEAGVLPSRELLAEMGKFNEELAKAGVMLAGEEADCYRWALCRDQGVGRRLLALAGEIEGRGYRMAQAGSVSGG
jgi:hypothetical protein